MTARQLYADLRRRLSARGIYAAAEYNTIFELAAGARYPDFDPGSELGEAAGNRALELAARRLGGEPLQYIAGRWPFLDFEVLVGEGVFIPRPETETLALAAIELLGGRERPRVADLCGGTGCLAIAVMRARPESSVTSVEREAAAFGYLEKNLDRLAPGVSAVNADVLGFEGGLEDGGLDLVMSNPPYVAPGEYRANIGELGWEPEAAFLGGDDGLDFYRYIIPRYRNKLKSGGVMIFEAGAGQAEAVSGLFRAAEYRDIAAFNDCFGMPRVISALRP
jgi:release factor glutamine methyltransferase